MRKLLIGGAVIMIIGGCAAAPTQPAVPLTNQTAPEIAWKTYSNSALGFSLSVPDRIVIADGSLAPLNIYEEKNAVYFSGYSLEDTLANRASWELKIMGTTVKSESEVLPFIESAYGVSGCKMEFLNSDFEVNPYPAGLMMADSALVKYVNISAKNPVLMPDDPAACGIGGKLRTWYRQPDGRVLTYQQLDLRFSLPNGYADEKVLESIRFLAVKDNAAETAGQCVCPDGYIKEGEACTPKCYFSTPPCLMPSRICNP